MRRRYLFLAGAPAVLALLVAMMTTTLLVQPRLAPAPLRYLAPAFRLDCPAHPCGVVQPGQVLHWTSHIAVAERVGLTTNASVWSLSCDRAAVVGRSDTEGTLTIPHAFADYAQRNSWTVPITLGPGAYQFTRQTYGQGTVATSYDIFFVLPGTPVC